MQVLHESELEAFLIEVSLEIQEKGLHPQLRASESGPVADRQSSCEIALGAPYATRISAERRDQLVWFDSDVRGRKAELPADSLPRLDRARHRILPAEQPLRVVAFAGRDQAPHLRAVQVVTVELERWDDLDLMSVLAQPGRAAGAPAPQGEVVAD